MCQVGSDFGELVEEALKVVVESKGSRVARVGWCFFDAGAGPQQFVVFGMVILA
jgi:hypothetical protein